MGNCEGKKEDDEDLRRLFDEDDEDEGLRRLLDEDEDLRRVREGSGGRVREGCGEDEDLRCVREGCDEDEDLRCVREGCDEDVNCGGKKDTDEKLDIGEDNLYEEEEAEGAPPTADVPELNPALNPSGLFHPNPCKFPQSIQCAAAHISSYTVFPVTPTSSSK